MHWRWLCFKRAEEPLDRKPGEKPTTVMHVSDLHFGYRFDSVLWQDVVRRAKSIRPDVIVVTGDIVNTPWRLAVYRAGRRLLALRTTLRQETGKSHLEIFAVPGNHDTRVSGLFPIGWLMPVAIASAVAAAALYWTGLRLESSLTRWLAAVPGFVTVVGCFLRALTTRHLARGDRGELFITKARVLDGFNVGVIPFDSASVGARYAAGTVKRGALGSFRDVASKYEAAAESMGVFWIAAVHHHPLPMPYDSGNETMMIMTNAGKFLHELASYAVPLILHGHKHHQHFSRLSFQTPYSSRSEIAVLSASTPTESNGVGAFRHGFNIIHVNEEHEATVSVYSAQPTGETFTRQESFFIADSAERARRRFEAYLARRGVYCNKATFTTTVDGFGDAVFSRRFQGVESRHVELSAIPGVFKLQCQEGHVGEVTIKAHSDVVPHMNIRESVRTVTDVEFSVDFEGSLLAPGLPIDFSIDVQGSNVFALDDQQYAELYIGDGSNLEHMVWTVPEGLAIGELQLHLKFEPNSVHPSQIRLTRALNASSGWRPCEEQVSFVPGDSSASVTIRHPQPNGRYRLTWRPPEQTNRASSTIEGKSRTARERLAFATDESKALIRNWLPQLAAVSAPRLFDLTQTAVVHAALFSYTSATKRLSVVASTYDGTDVRRWWSYGYGRGLPGRTFKLSSVAGFDASSCAEHGYSRYLRGDGHVATCDDDVLEGGAFAFPLCIVDGDKPIGEPFGILQLSVDGWGGQLLGSMKSDEELQVLQEMQVVFAEAVLGALDGVILDTDEEDEPCKNPKPPILFHGLRLRPKKGRTNSVRSSTAR